MLRKSAEILKSMGEKNEAFIKEIIDKTLESWIEMVDKSETPWALCEDCYKAVKIFILKGSSSGVKTYGVYIHLICRQYESLSCVGIMDAINPQWTEESDHERKWRRNS